MGTNYYLREKCCKECGRYNELHIGKSSGGWAFSLRIYPDLGIKTIDDWKTKWNDPDNHIFNEYERSITPEEMESCVLDREMPLQHHTGKHFTDGGMNAAVGGKTFDYCDYEFC